MGQDGLGGCWRFHNENFLRLVKLMQLGLARWRPRKTAGVGINSFPLRSQTCSPHTSHRLCNLVWRLSLDAGLDPHPPAVGSLRRLGYYGQSAWPTITPFPALKQKRSDAT